MNEQSHSTVRRLTEAEKKNFIELSEGLSIHLSRAKALTFIIRNALESPYDRETIQHCAQLLWILQDEIEAAEIFTDNGGE